MLKSIDFVSNLKKCLIVSACILLVGVVLTCVFGAKLDTDFAGGSVYQYSFTGEIDTEKVATLIKNEIGATAEVTKTTDISGESHKLVISFSGDITTQVNEDKVDAILEKLKETSSDRTNWQNP